MKGMKEKETNEYPLHKNIILNLNMDEFFLFDKKKHENILGLYTDGIATCSALVISINDDDYVFFCHMNEDSDIIYEIENKIIPIIESNKINNIKIIYSKGINCFSNNLKEIKILNLIDILNKKYTSKPIYYEHSISCSCLKLIKSSNNKNEIIFKTLIDKQYKIFDSRKKSNPKLLEKIKKEVIDFEKSILAKENIVFYFDSEVILNMEKLNGLIIL